MAMHQTYDPAPDPVLEKEILTKVTLRLMPILILGLFISYVDRANLGILYKPMSLSLGMSATAFGLAAGMFYIGYLLFEIPSNMAMTRFGARKWIARIMVSWGIVTIVMAGVQGEASLFALRVLLGIAEAGFFPGVLFYLTLWYPPRALGRSYSILEIAIPISLALASILTSSLLLLDGWAGLEGWRWVFILQGLPAVLLGGYVFFAMADGPGKAKWLSQQEKSYLQSQVTQSEGHEISEFRHLPVVFGNKVAWALAAVYFCMLIGFWSVTYFLPQIIQERFHVSPVKAGFLAAIPWLLAGIAIYLVGKSSERTGDRKWHMFVCLGTAGVGLFMGAAVDSPVLALLGLSLGAAGMQSSVPLFWTMPSTSFTAATAAIAIAMINSIGNLSGLIGPFMLGFFQDLTGNSRTGLYFMAGFFFLAAVLAFFASQHASRVQRATEIAKQDMCCKPVLD